MMLNYGITYADYQASLEKRIQVEVRREENHRKASEIARAFIPPAKAR